MVAGLGLGILLVLVLTLLTALSRAHELYCVSVRGGRSLIVRGSLPASTQDEIDKLFASSASDEVVIRAFDREGEVHLNVSGATDTEVRWLERLLGGLGPDDLPPPLPWQRTWWRFLGFVWLAWWIDGRNRDQPPEDPPDEPPSPPKSNVIPFRR